MKKYIMIAVALVLTACATTSPHALSVSLCPNGDEPTKTVSADGSYYVWVCAGSGSSSNGLLPDTLKQIKVVKDWEPITNHLALKNYVSKTSDNEHKKRWNAKYKG